MVFQVFFHLEMLFSTEEAGRALAVHCNLTEILWLSAKMIPGDPIYYAKVQGIASKVRAHQAPAAWGHSSQGPNQESMSSLHLPHSWTTFQKLRAEVHTQQSNELEW